MTKIVIIGATSGIAQEAAKIWLARAGAKTESLELILVARNSKKVAALAADYRIRNPRAVVSTIVSELVQAEDVHAIVQATTQATASATTSVNSTPIDTVLIAQGAMLSGDMAKTSEQEVAENLRLNAISPVLFMQSYANIFVELGYGTIAVIGSVAGDRGRKTNYVYGAAKGLIERFAQGLQHRLAGTGVRVVLLKPGPTATAMTADRRAAGEKMMSADQVAQGLVRAIDRGKAVAYLPGRWLLIMLIVRHIPRFIFHKLNF
ncbi:MAG: SDR family NAD(P)-dependent oxidoreductase [Microbacteriaceae bacterium]